DRCDTQLAHDAGVEVVAADTDDRGERTGSAGPGDAGGKADAAAVVLDVHGDTAAADRAGDVLHGARLHAQFIGFELRFDFRAAASAFALRRNASSAERGERIGQRRALVARVAGQAGNITVRAGELAAAAPVGRAGTAGTGRTARRTRTAAGRR